MESIKCKPGDLDDARKKFNKYSHFTVRTGKAKYHILYLATNSCGLYYGARINKIDGLLECRRVIEPTDNIVVWGDKIIDDDMSFLER